MASARTCGLLVACLVVAATTSGVHAWGPISHYAMTCAAVFPTTSIADCATDPTYDDLIVGSDIPDAFFFGSFLTGSSCTSSEALHNLVFAGYQVKLAQELINNGTVPANATFNPLHYALGFGAHVAADGAGFYPGGYLGNGHLKQAAIKNWISLWQFMTTVDSHFLKNYSIPYASLPTAPLPRAGASFISQATAYARANGANFPVLDESATFNCTSYWSETVNRNVRVANAFDANTVEHNLVFFDLYGATNPQQAASHLDMAFECAVKTIGIWAPTVVKSGITPEQAAKEAYSLLEHLVYSGECNPPSKHARTVFSPPDDLDLS